MAEDIGISTSYLNLMERNQRAMSAKVLLKLAERYDFDVAAFAGQSDAQMVAELYEVMRDPLFKMRRFPRPRRRTLCPSVRMRRAPC